MAYMSTQYYCKNMHLYARDRAYAELGAQQLRLHALIGGGDTRITRARDGFQPGPIANLEAPPHIGNQPGPLEESEDKTHGRAPYAEHLGQELLGKGEGRPPDPILGH